MFEVGDIVKIQYKGEDAMPKSPVINLAGSISRIIKVGTTGMYNPRKYYNIEFIERKEKWPEIGDGAEGSLSWRDEHFILIERPIDDMDVMSLFE